MKINKTNLHLGICVILSIGVALAYLFAKQELLLLVVIITCFFIIASRIETKIMYLLYFISWLLVLKLNPSAPSFFNLYVLLYLISTFVWLAKAKRKIIGPLVFSLSFLIIYCIFSSTLLNLVRFEDALSYIASFIIPFMIIHYYKSSMFEPYVYAYSIGIISSAILGNFANQIPMLKIFTKQQVDFLDGYTMNRFTGLIGDSNVFSMHILIAVSLLLVLIYYKPSRSKYLLVIGLTILGLLTVSKMFLITYCLIIFLYLFILYKSSIVRALKSSFSFVISMVIAILLGFNFLLNNYLLRFKSPTHNSFGLDLFTTGRYSIWKMYFNEIITNSKTFFVGKGLSASLLNGWQAHNTYLEMWYKIGIIGIIVFAVYMLITYKYIQIHNRAKIAPINYLPIIVLLISSVSLNNFGTALIMQLILIMTALKYRLTNDFD